MTLAEQYHAAHKARLERLSPKPVYIAPFIQPKPEPSCPPNTGWENMWFFDLISAHTKTPGQISVKDIQTAVAEHYGVSVSDILSHRRTLETVTPRHVAMFLTRKLTHRTLPEIGRLFGRRDHTTVLHACRKIEALAETDETMFGIITRLRRRLI